MKKLCRSLKCEMLKFLQCCCFFVQAWYSSTEGRVMDGLNDPSQALKRSIYVRHPSLRPLSLSLFTLSLFLSVCLSLSFSHTQPAFVITVVKYPVCIFPRCFFRRPFTAEECIHHRYALKAKFSAFFPISCFVNFCSILQTQASITEMLFC